MAFGVSAQCVSDEARSRIAGLNWWHTIEVTPGVVTPGWWDLRPTAERMPWPPEIAGLRCLDVGTMDGFWAFELERRGAREVVAIDPAAVAGPRPRERFRVAGELLGSQAEYRDLDVYDLDPAAIGEFDLIVMGYVLQMLRDPLRGLETVRSVCRGHLILLDTVSLPLSLLPAPLARLDARRDGTEWFVFNRRGLVKACTLAGFEVETVTPILGDYGNPARAWKEAALVARAMQALGLRGRSAAIRARPLR